MKARGKGITIAAAAVGLFTIVWVASYIPVWIEDWYLVLLDSEDQAERRRAAAKLAEMKSERAVPRLIELARPLVWREGHEFNEHYSVKALVAIGEPAVPPRRRHSRHLQQRSTDRRLEPRPQGAGPNEPLPGGFVLPAQRVRDHDSSAAPSCRRHPGTRTSFPR